MAETLNTYTTERGVIFTDVMIHVERTERDEE
jgi:hypothetical protein